jgi:hypothetical protein
VELTLFQPLYLDDIGAWRILQRSNRGIEVAMLLLQARKLLAQLAFFLFGHRRPGYAGVGHVIAPGRVPRKSFSSIAFWLMADKPEHSNTQWGIFDGPEKEYCRYGFGREGVRSHLTQGEMPHGD